MATQTPALDQNLDKSPAVAAMSTASATESSRSSKKTGDENKADNVMPSGDDTENSSKKEGNQDKEDDAIANFKPTPRFWAILITCAVIGLLSALENTVVTTALPHIVAELEMGENYVWITNVFFLTGYVPGSHIVITVGHVTSW